MIAQSNVVRLVPFGSLQAAVGSKCVEHASALCSVFGAQVTERLDQGDALFWQGDSARHVFEVVSGALRTVRVLSDGRRIITGFLFSGDLIGVSFQDRYLSTVEAIAPTKVRRIARRRFEDEVERSTALRAEMMRRLCDEMAVAQDQVILLARKNAEERVASFLLSLARRAGGDKQANVVMLPMTRLDMADYLGLTIETVSRIMTRLTGRGIIAATGRHEINIKLPATLAALAVEDEDDDLEQDVVWAS